MSSVLRGFNLPVSTYTTSQAQQAPPTFGQQAAGLGLGALGIYGAGKGVGLFAGGGDVPDNPGIKKLAAKAPQVVENMGFNPQEVINAYVGGKMNYDNGGSIYGFESLLGIPEMDPRRQAEIIKREGDERLERRRKEALEMDPEDAKKEIEDVKRLTEKYTPKYDAIGESLVLKESEKRKQDTKKDRKEDEIIITQTGNTNVNPNLIDSDNLTTTFTGLETDNILPQTDMGVSQSPYSALMNEQLASLFEKDKEGINIAEVGGYLGMIPALSGKPEDIAAATQSAIAAGKAKAELEKDKKSDMFKALTLGMSAEQFEKQFGISKDKAEADIGLAESKTKFYDAMAGGSKLNDALMKQLKKDQTYNDYLNNIQFNEQELRKAEEAKDADRVKDTQIALNNYIKRYTSTFVPTSDVAKLGEESMDNPFGNIRDNMLIQEIKSGID
jgi:hypothetical protein